MTNYSWSTGASTTSISVSPTSNSSYTVIATNANGCTASANATVSVSPPPVANISGSDTICSGNNIVLTATGGGNYFWNYFWNIGASTSSIIIAPSVTSSYSVIVSVGTCIDSATFNVNVLPTPTANAGTNLVINIGDSITLSASGGGNYSWFPPDGLSCVQCPNPVANPTATTNYCVVVTDANGCADTACVNVKVETNCGVYVPNAFSPNNDNVNDILYVYCKCIKEMTLTIYDRWGHKVFESDNIKKGWDGISDGKQLKTDVFVFHLNTTLLTGDVINKRGKVSLIR